MGVPVRRWLISGMALLCVFSAIALATAQDTRQVDLVFIGSVSVDAPVVALALPTETQVVALTGAQADVYDIRTTADPSLRLRSTIPLDGDASLLAAGAGYALTSTATPDGEYLTTLAPSTYNPRRGWEAIGLLQLPAPPVNLTTGETWGLISFADSYMALEIVSTDTINHRLVETDAAIAQMAVYGETAWIASADESAVQQIAFSAGPSVSAIQSIALDSPIVDLAISERIGLGAALLESGVVVLIEPTSGTPTASIAAIEDMDSLVFADTDDGTPHLLLSGRRSATIQFVNISDPTNPITASTIDLPGSPTGIAALGSQVVIADDDAITVYHLIR